MWSGPRSCLLAEWSAVSFSFNHKKLQGAITETRYFSVICVSRMYVIRQIKDDYSVQFNGAMHQCNHGNQVFSRDLCITEIRDMPNPRSNYSTQFNEAQHTVGQGGLALS